MKYSEFEMAMWKMNCEVDNSYESYTYIENSDGHNILSISKTSMYALSTNYYSFEELEDYVKKRLFNLAVELASTPLDEREDEKRYRLRLPLMKSHGYLNLDKIDGVYELSSELQVNNYQTIFTESEIVELKQDHILDSFIMEEVKEDE